MCNAILCQAKHLFIIAFIPYHLQEPPAEIRITDIFIHKFALFLRRASPRHDFEFVSLGCLCIISDAPFITFGIDDIIKSRYYAFLFLGGVG